MDTDKDFFSLESAELFADNAVGWVVVTSHAQHFIGRLGLAGADALNVFEPVTLYPAFEFSPMMVPIQRPGPDGRPVQTFARQPFISTPHFTIDPLTVRVQPTSYYLFSDMKEKDQALYKEFVQTAIAQAKRERLARSNLVAPNESDLRKVGQRGAGSA